MFRGVDDQANAGASHFRVRRSVLTRLPEHTANAVRDYFGTLGFQLSILMPFRSHTATAVALARITEALIF